MMNNKSWLHDGWIYQIFCGRWEGLDNGKSFFGSLIENDWEKITTLGCKTVYLLGVWDNQGPVLVNEEEGMNLAERENRLPSMMAISDHKKNNPNLGSEKELRDLIASLHARGFRVIADFVPNHTSRAHPWMEQHPEYYKKNNGEFIYEFSGDVAKLDYENKELREEMTNVLLAVGELGFDGVRCDMAHLIDDGFWHEAIAKVNLQKDDFVFIAECYENSAFEQGKTQALLHAGFDAIYDQSFYRNTIRTLMENQPIGEMAEHLNYVRGNLHGKLIQYAGNHDDPPLGNRNKEMEKSQAVDKYREALIAMVLFGGEVGMFANGFLLGANTRLAHHYLEKLPEKYNELLTSVDERIRRLFESYRERKNDSLRWKSDGSLLVGESDQMGEKIVINLGGDSVSIEQRLTHTSDSDDVNGHGRIVMPFQVEFL